MHPLDWAAMADLGWQVDPLLIPEPASAALMLLAGGVLTRRRIA